MKLMLTMLFAAVFSVNAYAAPAKKKMNYLGASSIAGSVMPVAHKRSFRKSVGPKPAKWCGWWMRTQFGGDARYNRARLWANRGKSAGGPRVGAIVVWPNHVGVITGKSGGRWVVKSGNDSNRVRERPRSVAGAIAFRVL